MEIEQAEIDRYREDGYLTLENVFSKSQMLTLIEDGEVWGKSFLENLNHEQRQWYLDSKSNNSESNDSSSESSLRLRKLDLPHIERKAFLDLLQSNPAMDILESLLGTGLVCLFSQLCPWTRTFTQLRNPNCYARVPEP